MGLIRFLNQSLFMVIDFPKWLKPQQLHLHICMEDCQGHKKRQRFTIY